MPTRAPSWSQLPIPILLAAGLLPLLGLSSAACAPALTSPAGGAVSKPVIAFPSAVDLAALPPTPVAGDAFATDVVAIDAWDFEGVPADGAAYDDPSPWGAILAEVADSRPGAITLDPALRCAAGEVARATMRKKGVPTTGFRRFAVARCGGAYAASAVRVWRYTLPEHATEAELATHVGPQLRAELTKSLAAAEHHALGFAAFREGREVRMVAVFAKDDVRLEPGSRKVDGSRKVTIRGAIRGEGESLDGLVNQGAAGVARCTGDPRVKLPRFAMTCALAPGDDAAWVEIALRKKERILSTSLATLMIYAKEEATLTYADSPVDSGTAAPSAAELTSTLLERLNAMRRAAKLAPVALAPKQTAENTRLAGNLLTASLGGKGAESDKIALGLLAGWDVSGLIRGGQFFLGEAVPARDAKAWLDFAASRPLARLALFDKSTKQVAIGAVVPSDVPAVAVAFTAYSFFDDGEHADDVEKLHAMLSEARRARGLAPHARVQETPELTSQARRVRDQGEAPSKALDRALQAVNETTGRTVNGFVGELNDVSQMAFPEELLSGDPVYLAIEVTHHKAPGAAWGQLVVFFVLVHAPIAPTP